MPEVQNPFVYEAASTLDDAQILDYYIDDHNHARLIQSKRNVFLVGERGSGKSMTLIYNTFRIQRLKAERGGEQPPLHTIGVLIPCNTPITHKREYQLLDEFRAAVVSEHFFALSIAFEIAGTLASIPEAVEGADAAMLREELGYVLGIDIPPGVPVFRGLQQAIQREIVETQRRINDPNSDAFYERSLSFAAIVLPLLQAARRVPPLAGSHFLLMIDDAHDLNEYQVRALNSWIAYRDRALFSFKVATAKVGRPKHFTSTGGSILEGHDFITIDLEKPIHNEESEFGQLAWKIVKRRLDECQMQRAPEEFFPLHPEFERELREAEARVHAQALEIYDEKETKKIADFVYKQRRPEYYRSRDPKANLPSYSGFSTIVYLSTGVIRNLLEPCWMMFDAALSAIPPEERGAGCVQHIPPQIQSQSILEQSKLLWELAERVHNLFDHLAAHFRDRLLHHRTEPGAISFSISQPAPEVMQELLPLLEIAQKAQLLYVREGPAKTQGRRERYYVPNRMLWPIRGLDPHGQHARASLRAAVLLQAARGIPIPFAAADNEAAQPELFDV
jgi:hypothetical protein